MNRPLMWAIPWLIVTGGAGAQEKPDVKKDPIGVVELLEDQTDFFIENLDNSGGKDGSVAARNEQTFFSGKCSLSVSSFQRFKPNMPSWNYQIAENPQPGEFRYVRLAWKRTEAPGIMLQFFVRPKTWKGYYAGTVSKRINLPMIRVADEPPREWELVTRDLFKDFGPINITGINFSAMEGPGQAYFDHIYLGQTIADLDGVTAARRNVAAAPSAAPVPEALEQPARGRWLFWAVSAVVLISLAGFLGLAFVLRLRRSKAVPPEGNEARRPVVKAGRKESKSHPKSTES